jgi:signal transduction histidine kinase
LYCDHRPRRTYEDFKAPWTIGAFPYSTRTVIAKRTAEIRLLSQRLLKVQDEERRKLARDLHDSTGQTLAALKIAVSFLQEKCKQDPGMSALVSELALLADQAIDEIRTMSYLLHPPLIEKEAGVRHYEVSSLASPTQYAASSSISADSEKSIRGQRGISPAPARQRTLSPSYSLKLPDRRHAGSNPNEHQADRY